MDLQELSDRAEIADVITRYTRAVDTKTYAPADTFTNDAILDYTQAGGPATYAKAALEWVGQMMGAFERWQHTIGQIEYDIDGDQAHVTAYFTNPMVAKREDGSEHVIEVGGYYHHDLVRTPGGWRSRKMVDDIVWMRGF